MAFTIQQVIDRARIPLQDAAKVRYSDPDLVDYANAAIQQLVQKRPDLFFGQFTTLPVALVAGGTFPLTDDYVQPVADFVTARAQFRNSEQKVKEAAVTFYKLFTDVGM